MSVTRLPSGRWRAQVYDPDTGRNVSVSQVLGGPGTFRTKTEAKTARENARERLAAYRADSAVTLAAFAERWTSDPLFARPKESTNMFNRERIKRFVERYGELPITSIDDAVVSEWLAGGQRNGTVPSLRAMFNDAASAKAGRLIDRNPFAGLGLRKSEGNRHRQPPPEAQMWSLLSHARQLTPPSFADWLEFGCFTAMRPGELDALSWRQIDFESDVIEVDVQWNVRTASFTEPKYGPYTIALVEHAKRRLVAIPRGGRFVFTTVRGTHYTPSSRNHHWNRVRAAAGLGNMTLYLATRHYFGYYGAEHPRTRAERDRGSAGAPRRRTAGRAALRPPRQAAVAGQDPRGIRPHGPGSPTPRRAGPLASRRNGGVHRRAAPRTRGRPWTEQRSVFAHTTRRQQARAQVTPAAA
jgi:integrase